MTVHKIIILARKHLSGDSARLCLADAVKLFDSGKLDAAKDRALRSLAYSVGIMHADYKRATADNRLRQCSGCGKLSRNIIGEYRKPDGSAGYINDEQDGKGMLCEKCRLA